MIDTDDYDTADYLLGWMSDCGIETVTVLLAGNDVFHEYHDTGIIPWTVFIDQHMVVQFTDPGFDIYDVEILVGQYCQSPIPRFVNLVYELSDDGNGNAHPDPGETCELIFTLENHPYFADAFNVHAELFSDDLDVDITNPYCAFPDIPSGGSGTSSPVEFFVDPELEPHITDFTLAVFADSLAEPQTFEFSLGLGHPYWLVVDDDGGENEAEWVINSFQDLDLYVDVQAGSDSIEQSELDQYEAVFWITGTSENTLNDWDQAALTGYLENGGALLLSSQYLGEDIGDTPFFSEVLHAEHTTDNMLYSWVDGIPGTPIAEEMEFLLAGSADGAANSVSPSSMIPLAPAEAFLKYRDQGEYAGTLYDNGVSKVIYLGFPMEAIGGLAGTTTRAEFLQAVLEWFDGTQGVDSRPVEVLADQFLLARAYPNPFNPVTTIEIDLSADASLDLRFYNLSGSLVQSTFQPHLTPGVHNFEFSDSDLASGIYLLQIEARRLLDGEHQREQLKLSLVK